MVTRLLKEDRGNDTDLFDDGGCTCDNTAYAIAIPSVCPSVTRVDQLKRSKFASCNFHHAVAPSLYFLRDKFHPEILMDPKSGTSNKGRVEKT